MPLLANPQWMPILAPSELAPSSKHATYQQSRQPTTCSKMQRKYRLEPHPQSCHTTAPCQKCKLPTPVTFPPIMTYRTDPVLTRIVWCHLFSVYQPRSATQSTTTLASTFGHKTTPPIRIGGRLNSNFAFQTYLQRANKSDTRQRHWSASS